MKPSRAAVIAGLFVLSLMSFDAWCLGSNSHAPEEDCTQFAQGVQTCPATFFNLSANPQAYDDKLVSLVGYLAIDTSRLFLYPSKDAYTFSDNASSIYIDVAFDEARKLADSHTQRFVQVVGTFSSRRLENRFGKRVGFIKLRGTPVVRDARPMDESTSAIDFDVELPSEN